MRTALMMMFNDIWFIIIIIVFTIFVLLLIGLVHGFQAGKRKIFDFAKDYEEATYNPSFKKKKPVYEITLIGTSPNKKNVFIANDAKHVFICGTTGSGKTIAISNFIKSGIDYNYPMLIIDGKGDTDTGSLLEITKSICLNENHKLYIINLNEPSKSDKYNPFKNTNTDVIKDMLINMTNWSEEHYKYNTERYIQRLCKLLSLHEVVVSLESLTNYLPTENFIKLSKELTTKGIISKEEHISDIELSKTSGKIAESAAARFATIKESDLGQIFDTSGIDIYTALNENAIILFILNPL